MESRPRDRDDAPHIHIVGGRVFVAGNPSIIQRFLSFLAAPGRASWRHRDLIAAILRRELRERFQGSAAGWIWALVAPLISLATYTFAFSGPVKISNETGMASRVDYALFIFGGLVAYNFFSEMAFRAPSLLHEYSHFIKQTMFPAEMLPIISTLRATAYTVISLTLMVVVQVVATSTLHWTVLLLPFWLAFFLVFLVGMTWLLSAFGAFTRDAAYLMMTIVPILMFATPVFFTVDGLSPTLKLLMYLNVMTGFIEIIRDIVVIGNVPQASVVAWTSFLAILSFYTGFWFFRRQRDSISDVI